MKVYICNQAKWHRANKHSARLLTKGDVKNKGALKNAISDLKRWKPDHSSHSYQELQFSRFSSQTSTQSSKGHHESFLIIPIQIWGTLPKKLALAAKSAVCWQGEKNAMPFSTSFSGELYSNIFGVLNLFLSFYSQNLTLFSALYFKLLKAIKIHLDFFSIKD